ncbi:accessory Sec system translocase SecA2 [Fictibacillus nanhaiensis]|uniref:accessory Sec system translocase SecA2 n=1 Tax=Fictibacillus nanhaiensis TaxID=742169 RepID=UPI002E23B817|nr:accessory Sec system translocase SecA2 [Fictibacillus nanhaiensis]MED1862453.1 accessory Sec system translocase SecA2 [Fictibacillus nanhaiensis]
MLTYLKNIIDEQHRTLKKYTKMVDHINELETIVEKYTNEELRARTTYFKEQLAEGKTIDDIKFEAFAVVREASKRVLGMRHFDVQLIGGLVLLEGNIAEMATGEGKTLVASLPSYVRALEGKGVHVITVNDYLARRDCEIIGQIHTFLGLTVGLNVPLMKPEEKSAAYQADITYGVGNEFGFDYLRDNMVSHPSQKVQRPYHFAILDEADSVLVDEARTPLIIAGKTQVSQELHYVCAQLVKRFKEDEHYLFDPETKAVSLTDEGIDRIESGFGIENLYDLDHQMLYHYVIQGLRAAIMLKRDVDYIVRDGKIELVDQFTGRILEGRTYSDGLHQAIEAKEGLQVTEENKTQASVTIQNYYRMYPMISGMTGTAKTEEKEFRDVYGVQVVPIPTNRPKVREDLSDRVYATHEHKYEAVAEEVARIHNTSQPVLIGTTSIAQSEEVASYLDKKGLTYQLLNAKSEEQEAQLISLAGQKSQITIATNMAGRGTDILLGEGVKELGGLYVIGTERHESRRIDNQLKGRSGRQGDPGKSQFFVSIQDDIVKRFARVELEKFEKGMKTDTAGLILNQSPLAFMDRVQRICEGFNYSSREYTLKLDDVVNQQRNIIYKMRDQLLEQQDMFPFVKEMAEDAVEKVYNDHITEELLPEEWDLAALQSDLRILYGNFISLNDRYSEEVDLQQHLKEQFSIYLNELESFLKLNDEMTEWLRGRTLMALDLEWVNHLEAMSHLKEGIGLRSYGQEDPMRIYEKEGLQIFIGTRHKIHKTTINQLTQFMQTLEIQKQNS